MFKVFSLLATVIVTTNLLKRSKAGIPDDNPESAKSKMERGSFVSRCHTVHNALMAGGGPTPRAAEILHTTYFTDTPVETLAEWLKGEVSALGTENPISDSTAIGTMEWPEPQPETSCCEDCDGCGDSDLEDEQEDEDE